MGLSKYIGRKIHESMENRKAEKAYQKEQRLNERNEYNQGRLEGARKRGVTEGSGGVTAQTKFQSSRGVQRVTGSGRGGFSGSIQHFDNIFGASTIGAGGGFGLGGGESRAPRPNRVITKANGKVKIEEYGNSHESGGGFGLGEGLGGGIMGGGIGLDFGGSPPGKKGKREERHPYDLF